MALCCPTCIYSRPLTIGPSCRNLSSTMSSLRTLTRALPRTTCRSYAPRVRLIQTSAKAAAGFAARDTRLALLGGTAIGLFATSLLWKSQQPIHLDAPPVEKEDDVVGM